jgi:CHAD domain-containing protein
MSRTLVACLFLLGLVVAGSAAAKKAPKSKERYALRLFAIDRQSAGAEVETAVREEFEKQFETRKELIARLEGTQRRARPEMLAIEQRLFPVVHDRLRRQLSRYGSPARLDPRGGRRTTAEATARRVAEAARRLERRLRRIETAADEAAIHRARISAKHLRYLLDPFVAVIPGGDVIVSRLRALQDVFGDVHDAHVFRPELATALAEAERQRQADLLPGIRSLIVSLGARGEAAFAIAAREWLVPARRAFFEELRAESRLLARRACRRRSPVARRWRSRRAVAVVSG